jgi:hypothetical protein
MTKHRPFDFVCVMLLAAAFALLLTLTLVPPHLLFPHVVMR